MHMKFQLYKEKQYKGEKLFLGTKHFQLVQYTFPDTSVQCNTINFCLIKIAHLSSDQ